MWKSEKQSKEKSCTLVHCISKEYQRCKKNFVCCNKNFVCCCVSKWVRCPSMLFSCQCVPCQQHKQQQHNFCKCEEEEVPFVVQQLRRCQGSWLWWQSQSSNPMLDSSPAGFLGVQWQVLQMLQRYWQPGHASSGPYPTNTIQILL